MELNKANLDAYLNGMIHRKTDDEFSEGWNSAISTVIKHIERYTEK